MPAKRVPRAVKKPSGGQSTKRTPDRLLPAFSGDTQAPERHRIGYARVSMSDQNNQRQIDALVAHGVDPSDIYTDKASGRSMRRPGWIACWKDLREGDVLVIHAIDRLGRDLIEVAQVIRDLHAKGAELLVLNQPGLDTRSSTGRLIFNVLLALAQWERESIVERTKHGLAAARERGNVGGAEQKISDAKVKAAMRRISKGERGVDVALEYGVRRQTLYKRWQEIREGNKR